eukprot:TRINITY_DN10910_c0_g1_i1.p1 TRINITY_DN10910_c0_g1~~TRINITY_DN10910_c0_g1_i1.p1  ORF type:complete len:181 (-),score=26.33 TRINITY_DN10910_c0_g1_i1:5-547(-)
MPGAAPVVTVTEAAIAALFPSVPSVMEFESWWTENGLRRYMLLLFYPANEIFEVLVDDSKVPLRVAVFNRDNQPLRAWDLYVGAVIDILGKPTTLMKCTHATCEWLDANAKRLWKRRLWLEKELTKFRVVPPLAAIEGPTVSRLFESDKHTALGGHIHLARLAKSVAFLSEELSHFRAVP